MRYLLLLMFVVSVNSSFGQKDKQKLAKSDTVLHFFASIQIKDGPYVISEPDSTIFPKSKQRFPVVVNMFEATNKRSLMIHSAAALNNNKRIVLENPRAKMFYYFNTREELLAELKKLETNNSGAIAYIPEFKFDKSFRNTLISMPQVK